MKIEKNVAEQEVFLSLSHLEKIYANGEKAVYNFNLDVKKGEFIVLVGPSGCGKSTTLRMIAGLEDITSGDIFLNGECLNYKPTKDRQMAFVFQSYALYPQMNVFQNIAFPLTINKHSLPMIERTVFPLCEAEKCLDSIHFDTISDALFAISGRKKAREERAASLLGVMPQTAGLLISFYDELLSEGISVFDDEREFIAVWKEKLARKKEIALQHLANKNIRVDTDGYVLNEDGERRYELRNYSAYELKKKVYRTAELLDLIPYLDKLPKELSGGQMQRVALGRAIVKEVPIFLMDEPLSNLDAKLRLIMRSEIVKLHNRIGATTIYVTHDQTEAMTMADRIVVMSKGFIQQIGTPEEVYSDPINLFVARFIGAPSMNMVQAEFDRENRLIHFGGIAIHVNEDFLQMHDGFYAKKISEFEQMLNAFDLTGREEFLKILSAAEHRTPRVQNKSERFQPFRKLMAIFKKMPLQNKQSAEKEFCMEYLEKLKLYAECVHPFVLGIRPERVQIERYDSAKNYVDSYITSPTVCELLGGEYHVHFDFCNSNMVGRFDATQKISTEDMIAVSFRPEDIYIFDPLTGERISKGILC